MDFDVVDLKHKNRPYTKSTISKKLKVTKKQLMNRKIRFRALRNFSVNLAPLERFFFYYDILGNSGVSPINCKYNQP